MGISGIGFDNYSSGLAVVKAADNPAAIGIIEGMENQERGYNTATDNARAGQDMLKTADSALQIMSGGLNRIRELAVKASNSATMTDKDIAAIQDEIEQLKSGIEDVARSTQYNKISLLDDDQNSFNLATNPEGSGSEIKFVNATLEALGIKDFDVTKEFDLNTIDEAISKITEERTELGATYNGLESTVSSNLISSENLVSSRSSIEDLDYAKASTEINKKNLIEQYKTFVQRKLMEDEKQRKTGLFNQQF